MDKGAAPYYSPIDFQSSFYNDEQPDNSYKEKPSYISTYLYLSSKFPIIAMYYQNPSQYIWYMEVYTYMY